jgi:hypothetical protein
MPAEIDQSGTLVGKFESDALHVAGVVTATIDVILDRHFLEGRGLIPRQRREIEVRVTAVCNSPPPRGGPRVSRRRPWPGCPTARR